ncbi:MAG TPA: hypothetical protein VE505_05980, partial [Vicinamibacterales bacterium]|nr:hypothetical protein [Vicinamibacterales bacterium]
DYAVVFAYLIAITIFGSRFARFQRTTGDYFLTGRTVPWWAICFTVVATHFGGALTLRSNSRTADVGQGFSPANLCAPAGLKGLPRTTTP